MYVIDECRRLEPDAKILLKIYEEGNSYRCAIIDSDPYDAPYDPVGMRDWALNKADYLLEVRWKDHQIFGPDKRKIITSYILPTYNLDMDTGFEEAVIEADNIMISEGFNQHSEEVQVGMVYYFLIGILMNTIDYPIRCGGSKDPYINICKKKIYEKYANKKYLLIDEITV